MDESILLPSPNWFLVSGMAVSPDGWLFYGSPSKSLCVLEPLPKDYNGVINDNNGFRTHVFSKPHSEKITSIDVSPDWPEIQAILTGSVDGSVKQWTLKKVNRALHIKSTCNHTVHSNDNEEVAGVAYSTSHYAITVGVFGRIVKWDLRSNIIKTFNLNLNKFRPTCIQCSYHLPLHVAIGTKQGVVIVVDLSDVGKIVYKVRSHDDEILSVSWCPQFNVVVKKLLKESDKRKSANARMEKIRQEAEKEETRQLDESAITKTLPEDSFDETIVEEDDMFDIYKDHEEDEFGHKKYQPEVITVKVDNNEDKEFDYLQECQKLREHILKTMDEPEPTINSLVEALDNTHVDDGEKDCEDKSMAKEREVADEKVGEFSQHPQKHLLATIGKHGNLRVWSKTGRLVASGALQSNLHRKNQQQQQQKINQPMWATLLWYKPEVLLITDAKGQLLQCNPLKIDCRNKLEWQLVDTLHKRGLFCVVSNAPRVQNPINCNDPVQNNGQLQENNQTKNSNQAQNNLGENDNQSHVNTENKDKTKFELPEDKWFVWTAAQDRSLVCYSMTERRKIITYNTCGGFIYTIKSCPYDARKVAVSVGDGAVRVWEADADDDDDAKLARGHVTTYWQNVQGKVLTVAWHPTKENILAFGTAEARRVLRMGAEQVGLLDVSGRAERAARVLDAGVAGGVYCLSWGERGELYASCGGDVAVHRFDKKDAEPRTIRIKLEGQAWQVTALQWYPAGLLCGSFTGAVGLVSTATYEIVAVNFVFKKMIHSLEWHPQFTSASSDESQFKDLVAVSSADKCCNIVVLKYSQKEDGTVQLETYKTLEGHKNCVLQLAWNPHIEGLLLSSGQDNTARVWDVAAGACRAVCAAHALCTLGVAWAAFPARARTALSGGGDCCLRLWHVDDHPPELHAESKYDKVSTKKYKKIAKAAAGDRPEDARSPEEARDCEAEPYGESREAQPMAGKVKIQRKFLLPVTSKLMGSCDVHTLRAMAAMCSSEMRREDAPEKPQFNNANLFVKIFGNTNEFNELLDYEMEKHLERREYESWIMLSIFRGHMDPMIQFASEHELLCPFLVSLAPSVSFKYWKDVTQMYLAQMDRTAAQDRGDRIEARQFGGAVYRRAALLLGAHDARGAADALLRARLHLDAYALCRARHMDSIAQEVLWHWAKDCMFNGWLKMAVISYIALGELYKASTTLASMNKDDEAWLSLAAELAAGAGQRAYAGHLQGRRGRARPADDAQETLEQLPTRIELLMKNNRDDVKSENGDLETKE